MSLLSDAESAPIYRTAGAIEANELKPQSAFLPNQLQFLIGKGGTAGKAFIFAEGGFVKDNSSHFPLEVKPCAVSPTNLAEAVRELQKAEQDPRRPFLVLGCPILEGPGSLAVRQRFHASGGYLTRTKHNIASKGQIACFAEAARHLYVIDFDPTSAQKRWCELQGLDVFFDPNRAVRACVEQFFPGEIQSCTYAYQLSSSCGLSGGSKKNLEAHNVKFHLFIWLAKPQYPSVVKAWLSEQVRRNSEDGFGEKNDNGQIAGGLDRSLYDAVHACYISVRFSGCDDPLAGKRWGIIDGESDALDLVLTDGRNGELHLVPGKRSSSYTTAVIQVGSGHSIRKISLATANSGERWPRDYRERLALISQRGTHNTCFHASRALGWYLISLHGNAETAKVSVECQQAIKEFYDAIDSKPRVDNSSERIAHHRREALEHINEGIDRAAAVLADQRARRRRVNPHFATEEVSLSEADGVLQTITADFFQRAVEHAAYRQVLQVRLTAGWLTPDAWPAYVAIPRRIIAVTAGGGKTHAALLAFLRSGLATTHRLYFFVPTHSKAKEIQDDFNKLADSIGSLARARVFSGIGHDRGGCLAKKKDKQRFEAAKACAELGISPKISACKDCALAGKCDWIKQADDRTPGLKVLPTAFLGLVIPGFAKAEETSDSDAPILGAVIDEDFLQSLKVQKSLRPSDVPLVSDFQLERTRRNGAKREILHNDEQWLLSEIANGARKLFEHEGPLSFAVFDELLSKHARAAVFGTACDLLAAYKRSIEKLVAAGVRDDLKSGRSVAFEAGDTLRRVTMLSDLLQTIRTVRFARPNAETTAACKIEHSKSGKRMHLYWYRRMPSQLTTLPLLMLDATVEPELAKLPFQTWDDEEGRDIELDVEFTKITIDAPHRTLIKIVGAPVGKRRFDEAGTKWVDKRKKRSKSERENLSAPDAPSAHKKRVPKRMHGNATWNTLLLIAEAVCGRAVNDGLKAGVITYKGVKEYAKEYGYFEGVPVGTFGNLRGLNTWKDCSALIVLGRTVPVDSALEDEAEARFALDLHGRVPLRGRGIKRVPRGVRVGSADGISIDVEEPSDPLVAMIYRAITTAEVAQAIGRDRGVRRTAANEVLVLDFSPVLVDATYSAIVDWSAFAGVTELAAVLHSRGVVPLRKPGHLKALAPWCFGSPDQAKADLRERTRQLFERAGLAKRNEIGHFVGNDLYKELSLYIGETPRNDVIRYAWPNLSSETVIYGDISAQELLQPAHIAVDTYRAKGAQDSLSCVVDDHRRAAAAKALKQATGCALGPASRGARRQDLPSPAARRMRALRERKKAGSHRQLSSGRRGKMHSKSSKSRRDQAHDQTIETSRARAKRTGSSPNSPQASRGGARGARAATAKKRSTPS